MENLLAHLIVLFDLGELVGELDELRVLFDEQTVCQLDLSQRCTLLLHLLLQFAIFICYLLDAK